MVEKLRTLKELRDVASDQQTNGLELAGTIDRDTASRLGINPSIVDQTLYDAFGQRQVATLFTPTKQYRVVLEALPEMAGHPEAISNIYVRPAVGDPIPITTFTRFTPRQTLLSVNHQGQFPAVTLSFNLAPGVALGQPRRRSAAPRRRSVYREASGGLRGTAQIFSGRSEPAPARARGAGRRLHRPRRAVRGYVHPVTCRSLDASLGGRQGAPRAPHLQD
jgi:multidrug efflux pump